MFFFTDLLRQAFHYQCIFRWHSLLLVGVLVSMPTAAADKLLIVGDSLSAGYQLPVEQSWAHLIALSWQKKSPPIRVINASISGDTTAQGLQRLPALLTRHHPRWLLLELGANDGLRGFAVQDIEKNLRALITQAQRAKITVLLMEIKVPPNYGKRYSLAFNQIYPRLAKEYNLRLLPFYLEEVLLKPEWMQQDGLHPNASAQPFIANWMEKHLLTVLR